MRECQGGNPIGKMLVQIIRKIQMIRIIRKIRKIRIIRKIRKIRKTNFQLIFRVLAGVMTMGVLNFPCSPLNDGWSA